MTMFQEPQKIITNTVISFVKSLNYKRFMSEMNSNEQKTDVLAILIEMHIHAVHNEKEWEGPYTLEGRRLYVEFLAQKRVYSD